MIALRRLTAVRGSFALGPVSLELPHGSHLAVVGPSGHGKTTLLWALAGVLPSSGEVSVEGVRLDGLPPERRGMSLAPQGGLLFTHLTVEENIRYGNPGADVPALARQFGCGELLPRSARALSGGQRMRVALARAVARPSAVLLLDEPLAGLDPAARAELVRALAELTPARTVIHVTHGLDEAAALSSHTLVIEEGRAKAFGPTAEVLPRAPGPVRA